MIIPTAAPPGGEHAARMGRGSVVTRPHPAPSAGRCGAGRCRRQPRTRRLDPLSAACTGYRRVRRGEPVASPAAQVSGARACRCPVGRSVGSVPSDGAAPRFAPPAAPGPSPQSPPPRRHDAAGTVSPRPAPRGARPALPCRVSCLAGPPRGADGPEPARRAVPWRRPAVASADGGPPRRAARRGGRGRWKAPRASPPAERRRAGRRPHGRLGSAPAGAGTTVAPVSRWRGRRGPPPRTAAR